MLCKNTFALGIRQILLFAKGKPWSTCYWVALIRKKCHVKSIRNAESGDQITTLVALLKRENFGMRDIFFMRYMIESWNHSCCYALHHLVFIRITPETRPLMVAIFQVRPEKCCIRGINNTKLSEKPIVWWLAEVGWLSSPQRPLVAMKSSVRAPRLRYHVSLAL